MQSLLSVWQLKADAELLVVESIEDLPVGEVCVVDPGTRGPLQSQPQSPTLLSPRETATAAGAYISSTRSLGPWISPITVSRREARIQPFSPSFSHISFAYWERLVKSVTQQTRTHLEKECSCQGMRQGGKAIRSAAGAGANIPCVSPCTSNSRDTRRGAASCWAAAACERRGGLTV